MYVHAPQDAILSPNTEQSRQEHEGKEDAYKLYAILMCVMKISGILDRNRMAKLRNVPFESWRNHEDRFDVITVSGTNREVSFFGLDSERSSSSSCGHVEAGVHAQTCSSERQQTSAKVQCRPPTE